MGGRSIDLDRWGELALSTVFEILDDKVCVADLGALDVQAVHPFLVADLAVRRVTVVIHISD